jgi:hypothetical protein
MYWKKRLGYSMILNMGVFLYSLRALVVENNMNGNIRRGWEPQKAVGEVKNYGL